MIILVVVSVTQMSQISWTESLKVKDLTEQIGQGFGVLDANGIIQYINGQLAHALGYQSDDIVGKPFEFIQTVNADLVVKVGSHNESDILLQSADGQTLHGKISMHSLTPAESSWYMLISIDDGQIKQFTPSFLTALEYAAPRMMIVDRDFKIRYTNIVFSDLSKSEMIGMSALLGVQKPYRSGLQNAIEAVFEEGISGTIEISESHPEKPARWFVLRISPIKHENEVLSVVLSSTDITDRVVMTKALQESEERLRGIFDNSSDGIILTDENGLVSAVNSSFERILGITKHEILNRPIWDVQRSIMTGSSRTIEDNQSSEEALTAFFEQNEASWLNKIIRGEFIHPKTGEPVWFEQQSFKIPTPNGHMLCSFVWDITQRVKDESALKRSEQLYKSLFEQTSDAILLLDLEGKHTDANESAVDLLGYSLSELKEISFTETVSPNELEEAKNRFSDLLSGKKLPIYERTFRTKNGEEVVVDMNVTLVRDDDGQPILIQSVIRDMTEKKRTLEALRENEERLDLALQGADLGVWDWDTERNELRFSERYAAILGFEPDEIGPDYNKWESLIHPDDLLKMEELWNAHVRGETESYSSEHRMRTKSGEYKWILERGKVIEHNPKGGTKRASGTILDITERVLAEQSLRSEEAKYKMIVEQSLIGIAILPEGPVNIAFANTKLGEMLGYSPFELEAMSTDEIVNIVCENDREYLRDYLRQVIRGETTEESIEVCMITKDHMKLWIEISAARIEYQAKSAVQVSFVDNTKRREMEDGLRQSEAKGRMLLQSLNDLVLVHDENDNYVEVFTGNENILYLNLDDIMGNHISEVLPDPVATDYLKHLREVRATGQSCSFDYPLELKVGLRWFSANLSLHEDGKSVVSVIRDITARYDAEQTLRRDRRIFHELAQAFIQTKDIDEVTSVILNELATSYGFDFGLFSQFDTSTNSLRMTASVGVLSDEVPQHIEITDVAADSFLIAHVFNSKIALFISDIEREVSEKSYLSRIRKLGAKSVMAAPILDDNNNVLAVYSFATTQVRTFDTSDFEIFSTITNMLGTALERREAEIQKQKAQETLERERQAFQSIANSVVHSTDTSELSSQIIQGLIDSLGFDFGTLRLYDDKEGVLNPTAIIGIEPSKLSSSIPVPKDGEPKHLVSLVAIEKTQVIASDISMNPYTLKFKERLDYLGVKSVVVWSILDESEQLVGILTIGSYESREISETTRPFFNAVSGMLNTLIERMKTEQALRISERRYRELLTDMSEGIGIADLDERLIFVNLAFAEMLGYEQDELIGISILDLVDPEEIQTIVKQTILRKEGISSNYTHSFIRKDGEKRSVRVSVVPSRNNEGIVDGSVAIVTDITERLQAEAALKESEVRFRNIFNSSPVGMHLIEQADDGQLFLVDANPAADKMLGSNHDEFYGRPLSYVMKDRPDHKKVIGAYHEVLRTGRTWNSSDVRYENDEINSAIQVQAFRTSERTMVVSLLDVTDQIIAQKALKDSEALFRSVFETTPVGMHLVEISDDDKLILIDANPAARKNEEKSGRKTFTIGKPLNYEIAGLQGQDVIDRFKEILMTGKPWNLEDVFYNKDDIAIGAVQLQIFRATPHTIVTSFLDISDRYISEKQIRELNEELAKRVDERTTELAAANKELEAFAYSVSHDLRAPLRSIDGFSQALLEDYSDNIDETGRDYLNRVRAGVSRMAELIEDILGLSRVTRSDMVRTDVNLSEIVREILKEKTDAEPDREVDIRIADVHSARCDQRLIRIALQNLLDNAWKFTRTTEQSRISFGSTEINGTMAYYVRDNGAGFDMKYKEKLFAPFQRLHSSDEFEGSGIGLATVQRIINRHGGNIWPESEVDKGTTIYFTIPP